MLGCSNLLMIDASTSKSSLARSLALDLSFLTATRFSAPVIKHLSLAEQTSPNSPTSAKRERERAERC